MEHHKFKKCHENGFCNRLRRSKQPSTTPLNAKKSHYVIEATKLTNKDSFTAKLIDLKNKRYNGPLKLLINVYENGIFRLRIREWTDIDNVKLEKRYEVKDVLMQHVILKAFDTHNEQKLTLGDVELQIYHGNENKPFHLTLIVSGKEAIVVNGNELLRMESFFVKQEEQRLESILNKEKSENAKPEDHQQEKDQNNVEKYEGESAFGIDFTFPGAKHVYGIPERATDLPLDSTFGDKTESEPYRLFNLDIFEYELNNPIGLYGAIPLLLSLKKGLSAGVFVLNPSNSFVDIEHTGAGTNAHWMCEFGLLDVFLLPGTTPREILNQYSYLTGYNFLPQEFALGYHQCRWNYKDENDVLTVDAKFDEHNIPMDVIWLDIEHTDQKKYFTWDKHLFPNPKRMLDKIAGKARKMVTITDPHIKRVSGYHVHDEATKYGYYVKRSDGSDYEGQCWPGSSSWLDFFNPETRNFYSKLFRFDKYEGSASNLYTWIDMNEPSVFSGPEITMDKDAVHYGGLIHGEVHNLYGFYHGMATYQGHIDRRSGEDRPFILSRSFFAGSQRYVAMWTGDNAAKWSHLDKAQNMLLALSISGFSFIGADVGGFFGNPDAQLLVRWYQAGAFYPFFRAHAHIETQRREPWLFGEDNMNLIRAAIQRRYSLLPYYYTLAFHASVNAAPIMRPLFFDYVDEEETYDIQDQFLIGSNLLVKPVVDEGVDSLQVYLPGKSNNTIWYDYEDFKAYPASSKTTTFATPLHKIPVLQRGGSIIPTKIRMRRSSALMVNDPFTLRIALNEKHEAYGDLYLDDGHSFLYEKGQYLYLSFAFENNTLKATRGNLSKVILDKNSRRMLPSEKYTVSNTIEKIIIAGYPSKPKKITLTMHATEPSTSNLPEAIDLQAELEFTYDATMKKLTVRKPLVAIDSKWSIAFE
jgi:alpha 1,3-glucosidase